MASAPRSPLTFANENASPIVRPGCAGEGEQPQAQRPRLTEALRVKKLNGDATLPVRGSAGAAGYDLSRCGPSSLRQPPRSIDGWARSKGTQRPSSFSSKSSTLAQRYGRSRASARKGAH